jgi:hypothetical protein
MYAKDMDEEEAAEWLDGVLADSGANGVPNGRKKTTSAKPAKVASKNAAKPVARTPAARKPATKPAARAKPKTKARATSR